MKLWMNAKFYSMNKENKFYTRVITKNGVIIALDDECDNYQANEIIDLKGAYIYPGFTDSHMHLIGYGRKLYNYNLNLNKDKNEILQIINSLFNESDLLIEGYFNIGITKDDLDKISKDKIIILRHSDYHSFTVNSKVLELINIKGNGIILDDEIAKLVKPYWENNSKERLTKFGELAIESLIKNGISSIHTDDLAYFNSYLETIDILDNLSKKYNFRINTLINYDILNDYLNYYPKNNLLTPIQVKMFYDGTIQSKTALINGYYKNTNINGTRYLKIKELEERIKKIRSLDKGLAIHVIGDKALEEVINTLNKYNKASEPDRIVHGSLANIKVLDNINIPIDIQPLFKITDNKFINDFINHNTLIYPFKEYNDKNIVINGSSDAPVEDINPLKGIITLIESGLSRFDAIKCYTVNPNLTINKKIGLIEKGYLADFVGFNYDLFTIDVYDIIKIKVIYNIIESKIVYQKI